ncbi:MAG TPA: hypothetical protein DDW83_00610 [Peptococcaceae bacterium]|nr:hypothetical protein [Peptococcaceae bacterium]
MASLQVGDDHGLVSFFSYTRGACDETEVDVFDLFSILFELSHYPGNIFSYACRRCLDNCRIKPALQLATGIILATPLIASGWLYFHKEFTSEQTAFQKH